MKRVMMLLANGVEPLEMAAFTDVLGWANLVGDEAIELQDVGLRQQVKTTFGLNLRPNYLLPDIDLNEFDALAIPGGFEPSGFYDEALSEPFLNVIRHFATQDQCIASVCVSSLCLGEAGILEQRNATIYHQDGGRRKQQLEATGACFVDRPIVVDGRIVTSTGPGTAIEVAFELLAQLTSRQNADHVKSRMRMPTPQSQWFRTPQVSE